jgi:hypothetical protein
MKEMMLQCKSTGKENICQRGAYELEAKLMTKEIGEI